MVLVDPLPPAVLPQCLPTSEAREIGSIFMGREREGSGHFWFSFGLFRNKQNFPETL